jgi:anti-sigma factor RsiW
MTCEWGSDAAEQYVTGTMPEPTQASFEEHYFACDACFKTVEALQAAGKRLESTVPKTVNAPGRRWIRPVSWMAAAATVIVGVILWRLPQPGIPATPSSAPAAAASQPAAGPLASTPPASALDRQLDRMATVAPPQYVTLITRSQSDESATGFEQAMTHYVAGRYDHAARGLSATANRSPNLPHVQFFLGISELMLGNLDAARKALQRTARSGVNPYADEAHFYLGKLALRAKDIPAARREFQIAAVRKAGPTGEAAKLLAELKQLKIGDTHP